MNINSKIKRIVASILAIVIIFSMIVSMALMAIY